MEEHQDRIDAEGVAYRPSTHKFLLLLAPAVVFGPSCVKRSLG